MFCKCLEIFSNIPSLSLKPRSCLEGVMLLVVEFRSDPAENEMSAVKRLNHFRVLMNWR